jgi:hypothetical protein
MAMKLILGLLLGLSISIGIWLANALAVMFLWNWFLPFDDIRLRQAAGIAILGLLFAYSTSPKIEDGKDLFDFMMGQLLRPLLFLFMGWIVS